MKIRDIRLSDDGTFEFSAIFQNGVTFFDRVRLMVLGKYDSHWGIPLSFECKLNFDDDG